jgi:hypothetical protein
MEYLLKWCSENNIELGKPLPGSSKPTLVYEGIRYTVYTMKEAFILSSPGSIKYFESPDAKLKLTKANGTKNC